jgi:hypothetical protein
VPRTRPGARGTPGAGAAVHAARPRRRAAGGRLVLDRDAQRRPRRSSVPGANRQPAHAPRSYTIEPHKLLIDTWRVAAIGAADYDLAVHGPNGFFRGFKRTISGAARANLDVHAIYEEEDEAIRLEISNRRTQTIKISVRNVYRAKTVSSTLGAGDTDSKT